MSDSSSLTPRTRLWSRVDLGIALAIGIAVAFAASTAARSFSNSGFTASFYQGQFGPAVLYACGHGFQNPPLPEKTQEGYLQNLVAVSPGFEALNDFLLLRRTEFDCAELPQAFEGTPPILFQGGHRYLLWLAGMVWKLNGVSWPGLSVLAGAFAGMTGALIYLFFRAGMGMLLALTFTLIAALSPLQLSQLPHLRDYAKAPFFMATLCAIAWIALARPSRPRTIVGLAAIGALLGFGFGIRTDVFSYLPLLLIAILVFRPGFDWQDLVTRVAAGVAATAAFLVIALPILRAYQTGDNLAHVAILGMTDPSHDWLRIRAAPYSFGYLYHDGYMATVFAAYAERSAELTKPLLLGTREYAFWGNEYYGRLMSLFPADVLIRAWAAVASVFEMPFAQVNMARPPWVGPFVGSAFDWRATILLWLGTVSPLVAAAVFAVAAGAYSLRLAGATLLIGVIVTGMTSLQFQGRHVFHLEPLSIFIYGCLLAAMWRLVRSRLPLPADGMKAAAGRAALVAITLALGIVIPIYLARSYQTGTATTLLSSYEQAATEPVPVTPSPAADPEVVLLGMALPLSSSPERWVDTNVLSVAMGGEGCDSELVPVTFRYRAVDPFADLSRRAVVPVAPGPSATTIVFPVYTLGLKSTVRDQLTFSGIEVPVSQQSCIVSVSRFSQPADFPILLESTLLPDWRTRRLYETLEEFERPADGWYETYSAPEMLRPGRRWLSLLEKVSSPPTFKSMQVTRVDPDGIEIRGNADTAAAYLLSWSYAQRERGSAFFVEGEIIDGGLMIGIQQNEQWANTVNVVRPGKFRAIVRVDAAGSYGAVIANLQLKGLYNRSTIMRYGWLPSTP